MIEHISRSEIKFVFKGRRVSVGGELYLPSADQTKGVFEAVSQTVTKWEDGSAIDADTRRALLDALCKEATESGKVKVEVIH